MAKRKVSSVTLVRIAIDSPTYVKIVSSNGIKYWYAGKASLDRLTKLLRSIPPEVDAYSDVLYVHWWL